MTKTVDYSKLLKEEDYERFIEYAAILEYDGGLKRQDADRNAFLQVLKVKKRFKELELFGGKNEVAKTEL